MTIRMAKEVFYYYYYLFIYLFFIFYYFWIFYFSIFYFILFLDFLIFGFFFGFFVWIVSLFRMFCWSFFFRRCAACVRRRRFRPVFLSTISNAYYRVLSLIVLWSVIPFAYVERFGDSVSSLYSVQSAHSKRGTAQEQRSYK